MKETPKATFQRLRRALAESADTSKAGAMQAYMKSSMPYHGVPTPQCRRICRELFKTVSFNTEKEWQRLVLHIWRGAQFREERYAAIEFCELRAADPYQTMDALPLYEEMIVTGAWWDYVDVIASHRLGTLLRRYPRVMGREMRAWSRCDDVWKRRAAILCQLQFKKDTDLRLLYDCIEPSVPSREFFLRKAIGWALRQYAWTNPKEVRRYVRENQKRLSPLSKKEALKNLNRPAAST